MNAGGKDADDKTDLEGVMGDTKKYEIAVIGDTSSGKTMLLLGLIMTSKKGLTGDSSDHQDEIAELRKSLQNGIIPAGTTKLTTYNIVLRKSHLFRRGASIYPLTFRDYKGGDIANGISFFDEIFDKVDGVLFLMNPGQAVLGLVDGRNADDVNLSGWTNLINNISGSGVDRKCRAVAIAAAVTAADRISEKGDLFEKRDTFLNLFRRYIVHPLETNASGIAFNTDFEISVTGHVESQDKLKIDPENNAADPFLWLIDQIERKKHPYLYWLKRLWPVFCLALLAVIGCVTWLWQHNCVEDINKEGERIFNKAQTEFKDTGTEVTHTGYSQQVRFLGTSVTNLYRLFTPFPDVREKKNVAYTNLLTKYLIATADVEYLKMRDDIKNSKLKPESDHAYALRLSSCEIETPSAFIEYKADGHSNEVKIAEIQLQAHRETKLLEVISEYNENYFDAKIDMLETNAARVASQEYIQGLTNELAVWKQECSAIPTLSNNIEYIGHSIVARCPAWRAAYASNIVQSVKSFEYEVKKHPDETFLFEKKKLGPKLRELLTVEETTDQLNLDSVKKGLLKACRESYFEQERFKTSAKQYPEDNKLRDNLTRLLQGTTLTNCVTDWTTELHEKQRQWLLAEKGRVQDWIEKAEDYSKFLTRPREGTGDKVHSLLVNCWKWADEETDAEKKTIFDKDCKKVWEQFIARYFTENKWKFGDNYDYPSAEDNLEDKIVSFLGNTRITDVTVETDNLLSKMREMQKQWLMDAMESWQKFPDGFDAFDVDGSGEDIKRVLVATKQFTDDSISEPNDKKRIDYVEAKRKELIETMNRKYFEDDKFKSGHEFSIRESGIQVYRSEEGKMIAGLQKIFVAETGYDFDNITNDWSRTLWQHERDWLAESQSMCTNGVCKFDGKASTIVNFVARHQGNPFLWDYAMRIKANNNDFGLQQFRDDLKDYAERGGSVYNLEAKSKELQKTASVLSAQASGMNGQYSGLFDIFALRHLCTNCVPSQVGNRFGVNSVKEITAQMKEAAKNLQQDENWLSTEYNIESVEVSLSHPLGVVPYRPRKWNKVQLNRDMFGVSVSTGRVDYVDENFITTETKTVGESEQVESSCIIMKQAVTRKAKMRLFSDLEFYGTLWEEYTRDAQEKGESSRNLEPVGTKKSPMYWAVSVRTPHLRAGISVPVENIFEYASRAGKWKNSNPPTQQAKLSVSVYGNVVGQTPFERIDGCIKKAAVEADDGQNEWRKKFEEAEKRLNELNHILSEEDGSEVEGRN